MALTASRAKTQLSQNQKYDSLARWVLDKRLWMLSWYTGLGVVASTSLLALLTQYTITFSALITVPVFSFLMCISSILPLVLLRRWDLQSTEIPATSYSAQISTLAHKPATYRTIGLAAASFAAFALLNCLCAAALGAHNWHLFAPTKRHSLNLNENVIVLMAGNALVGALLASRDLLASRAVVRWPSKISMKAHTLVEHVAIYFAVGVPIVLALAVTTQFTIVYWLFRKAFYRNLMRLPILGLFVKPFIIQAARPSTSVPIFSMLYPRLVIVAIITAIHYENAQAFFDSIAGRGMLVARDSVDPDACLRSGIEASDEYYQHFAYLELAHIARKGPATRRAPVFSDPTKWHFISRACLKLLGTHYGHLKRRGKPPPPPPVEPAPAPALPSPFSSSIAGYPSTPRKQATLVPNLNSSVYKPAPPPSPGAMFIRSLLSSSTISPPPSASSAGSPPAAVDTPASNGRTPLKSGAMPSVFVVRAPEEQNKVDGAPAPAPAPPAAPGGAPTSLLGLIWQGVVWVIRQITARVPSPTGQNGQPFIVTPWFVKRTRDWLDKERVELQVKGILMGKDMDGLCIQILTGFTVASLKEDAYGTLQQDIPRILEALTKMLLALEEYSMELRATAAAAGSEAQFETEIAIEEFILPFTNDITTGLKEIMLVFGDRLNVFRLPLPVARRLQPMAG